MADNLTLNAGSGGDTLATDDIGGVHYQIVKLTYGALDSSTLVSTSNGLPVAQQGAWNITNVSGTVSLPTGAATAAKQPALGTAGTASSDVLSIQGIASMTPLQVADNGGTLSIDDGAGSITVDGTVTANLASGTNNIGDVDVLTVPADPFGANADAASATGSISAKLRFIASTGIPITGTVTVGSHAVTNAGTFAVQAAQSGTWTVTGTGGTFPVTDSAGSLTVDAPVGTPVFVRLSDGSAAITNLAANCTQIGGTTVATGNGTASAGCQRVTIASDNTAFSVNGTLKTATSGGFSVATGSITNTATAVKAAAGQVYGWYIYNPNASAVYVQFFNTATGSTTVGTTTPVYSIGIPATSGANVFNAIGIAHSTAITIAITTTRAGSTAPGSSVDYNVFYA